MIAVPALPDAAAAHRGGKRAIDEQIVDASRVLRRRIPGRAGVDEPHVHERSDAATIWCRVEVAEHDGGSAHCGADDLLQLCEVYAPGVRRRIGVMVEHPK